MISKGKHGDLLMRRYHQRGEPCPIAVVVGVHPGLFAVAGLEIPYGKNEYEAAGGLLGEAIRIVGGPVTGLPIPAEAEIAFEGFVAQGRSRQRRAARRMDRLLCRRPQARAGNPRQNLLASRRADPDRRHPGGAAERRHVLSRHRARRRGVAGTRGGRRAGSQGRVVARGRRQPACGSPWRSSRCMPAIRNRPASSPRNAMPAPMPTAVVVVVDDDIDPADMDQVVWAICTRCDPRDDVQILNGCWSTTLDPMAYPPDRRNMNSRMVIDACTPWNRQGGLAGDGAQQRRGSNRRCGRSLRGMLPQGW